MCGDHATRTHRTPLNCTFENNQREILGHMNSTKIIKKKKKKKEGTIVKLGFGKVWTPHRGSVLSWKDVTCNRTRSSLALIKKFSVTPSRWQGERSYVACTGRHHDDDVSKPPARPAVSSQPRAPRTHVGKVLPLLLWPWGQLSPLQLLDTWQIIARQHEGFCTSFVYY